jgi:hypothetical protein
MTDNELPQWQKLYQKAILERDPEVLPEAIARAESAIHARLNRLSKHGKDETERQTLTEALSALRVLKEQHFPDWNRRSAKRRGA